MNPVIVGILRAIGTFMLIAAWRYDRAYRDGMPGRGRHDLIVVAWAVPATILIPLPGDL